MGRMVANKGNGQCVSTSDPITCTPMPLDIVLVPAPPGPPMPTPCVNTAKLADATQTIDNVLVNGKSIVVRRSVIPTSSGAPANAIKGIISPPPANNRCNFVTSSATVFAGGYPIERHRDVTAQNAGNCPGVVKLSEAFCLDGSGIVIDSSMNTAQREAILRNLEELYERPRTRELLDTLRNNYQNRIQNGNPANQITLSANDMSGNPCTPLGAAHANIGPWANRSNGVGNPSRVQFHPTQSANLPGYGQVTPSLVLAHELTHALHNTQGTTVMGNVVGTMPNGTPANPMTAREAQTMGIGNYSNERLAESRYAEERGMQVRTSHGPSEGSFPHNPQPGNVAPQGFAVSASGAHFVYCNR